MKLKSLKILFIALAVFGGIALCYGQSPVNNNEMFSQTGCKYYLEASTDGIHYQSSGTIFSNSPLTQSSFNKFIETTPVGDFKYYAVREILYTESNSDIYGNTLFVYIRK